MLNTFAHTTIDTIQTGKKQFVSTFVKHDDIKKALNGFVDAQTKYTKSAFDAGYNTFTQLSAIVTQPNFVNDTKNVFADMTSVFVPEFLKTNTGKK